MKLSSRLVDCKNLAREKSLWPAAVTRSLPGTAPGTAALPAILAPKNRDPTSSPSPPPPPVSSSPSDLLNVQIRNLLCCHSRGRQPPLQPLRLQRGHVVGVELQTGIPRGPDRFLHRGRPRHVALCNAA
jgi:hypothetical protein